MKSFLSSILVSIIPLFLAGGIAGAFPENSINILHSGNLQGYTIPKQK